MILAGTKHQTADLIITTISTMVAQMNIGSHTTSSICAPRVHMHNYGLAHVGLPSHAYAYHHCNERQHGTKNIFTITMALTDADDHTAKARNWQAGMGPSSENNNMMTWGNALSGAPTTNCFQVSSQTIFPLKNKMQT